MLQAESAEIRRRTTWRLRLGSPIGLLEVILIQFMTVISIERVAGKNYSKLMQIFWHHTNIHMPIPRETS